MSGRGDLEVVERSSFRSPTSETLVVRERTSSVAPPITVETGAILGSYRIISKLKSGSVGHVYLAEHTILQRRVALKMLRPELSQNPKLVKRFFAEARAVNEIAHENIVSITDFVIGGDHPSFYVMELLEGSTLEEILASRRLEVAVILEIGIQLASALAAVHQKGIVHRDLKPANVFLVAQPNGGFRVKLLDFGVAKMVGGSAGPKVDTAVGALLGTPDYMAPEATFGLEVDHRADLYSLGCLLYQMTTGCLPFEAESVEAILELHRTADPIPPQELAKMPDRLATMILLCLAKKPEERPPSVDLIRRGLMGLRPRRDSSFVGWAAFLGIVLLAVAGWLLVDLGRQPERIVIPAAMSVLPDPVEQRAAPVEEPKAPQLEEAVAPPPPRKKRTKRRSRPEAEIEPRLAPQTIDRAATKANPYD